MQVERQDERARSREEPGRRLLFFGGLFSAMLLGLAFPPFENRLLPWFALVPLFISLHLNRGSPARRVVHALVFGIFLGSWSLAPLAGARYREALADGALAGLRAAVTDAGGILLVLLGCWVLFATVAGPLLRSRSLWIPLLGVPLLWTGLEKLRLEHLHWCFPHLTLGSSLDPASPEAQTAALFGLLGLSFAIALANTALFLVLREGSWARQIALTVLAGVVFLGSFLYGTWSGENGDRARALRVGILQTSNHGVSLAEAGPLALARALTDSHPDLILFPEGAFDRPLEDGSVLSPLRELSRRGILLIVGAPVGNDPDPAARERPSPRSDDDASPEICESSPSPASVMVLIEDGEKRHDPVRAGSRLWFEEGSTCAEGPAVIATPEGRIGIVLGADLYRPSVVRELVASGAEAIFAGARDGRRLGPEVAGVHHRLAAIRAVENRRWLARATRGGQSAIVTATGEKAAAAPPGLEWATVADVEFSERRSIYTRWGWLLGSASFFGAIVLTVLAALPGLRRVAGRLRAPRR